jgi:hypothetical protein
VSAHRFFSGKAGDMNRGRVPVDYRLGTVHQENALREVIEKPPRGKCREKLRRRI